MVIDAGEGAMPVVDQLLTLAAVIVGAKNEVHQRIRAELGIPGRFLPRDLEQPYDPKLPEPAEAGQPRPR